MQPHACADRHAHDGHSQHGGPEHGHSQHGGPEHGDAQHGHPKVSPFRWGDRDMDLRLPLWDAVIDSERGTNQGRAE